MAMEDVLQGRIYSVDELQADFKQFRQFLEESHPQQQAFFNGILIGKTALQFKLYYIVLKVSDCRVVL